MLTTPLFMEVSLPSSRKEIADWVRAVRHCDDPETLRVAMGKWHQAGMLSRRERPSTILAARIEILRRKYDKLLAARS